MKDFNLLVWLTQLGLSVVLPFGGCILVAVWLRNQFGLGVWVVIVGAVFGFICAIEGLRNSLKILKKMTDKKDKDEPPVSFNEHQ